MTLYNSQKVHSNMNTNKTLRDKCHNHNALGYKSDSRLSPRVGNIILLLSENTLRNHIIERQSTSTKPYSEP